MATVPEENQQRVVKLVQEMLLSEEDRSAITPTLIEAKIELVLQMMPKWRDGLEKEQVVDELIRRFSVWIGQDTTLKSDAGHVPWLNATRKKGWRYWQRYDEWLERKMSRAAIDALDRSTDSILGFLEDPQRDGPWNRRGLVVGHVQSGKTGSYTGLICKAADAGYKIVIVLAGLHNNLRSQTQVRLDEGFLGYETSPIPENLAPIGVSEIDSDQAIRPNFATNRSEKGDFSTSASRNLGISPEQRPWLFVVKKNKTVLERLLRWINNHVANTRDPDSGRRVVTHLPLLLIDDEADHASVDTGELVLDSEGRPDEDHQPTAINSRIRRILAAFSRSAYVGYTATPFANIFIHERAETQEEGPDIFPSSFIINLAAPSNYIGPARVFGLITPEGRNGGLPLVRTVTDHTGEDGKGGWMPTGHKNGHLPSIELPASLVEAIDAFMLGCAVRLLRGQQGEHTSMLIHVTRFNSVQNAVHAQVQEHVRQTRQRILRRVGHEPILDRMSKLWRADFEPTTEGVIAIGIDPVELTQVEWEQVLSVLPDAIEDIDVRTINGTAKDTLDYSEKRDIGLKVIAIGGDKLARGLTLEGLCVSYFLRASKMYDTLMQMGRWFGYRPGYLDLCRLYTTTDLVRWFGHIADASEELREEFDLMAAAGATPREYGLKVQSHPVLMVTSRLKMRAAKNLLLSFSGQLVETVALYRDPGVLARNVDAAKDLLRGLPAPEVDPRRRRGGATQRWEGYLWNDVTATRVIGFLAAYKTHPDAYKVNSPLLAQFVESLVSAGELMRWTVALIGGGEGATIALSDGLPLSMLKRVQNGDREGRYSIGRLLSPRDEAIDLEDAEWQAALTLTRAAAHVDPGRQKPDKEPDTPNGPAIRKVRGFGAEGVAAHPERGLLLIYALDPAKADAGFASDTPPVIAFGISFPGSTTGLKVEYKVNNVLWEQEYGPAE